MPLEFRGVSSLYRNFSAECYKWGEEQSHFEKLPIYIFLISPSVGFLFRKEIKMANYCSNIMQMSFPDKERMNEVSSQILRQTKTGFDFSFGFLVPQPVELEKDQIHRWRRSNWGCIYDANLTRIESGDSHLVIEFDTPWCPPEGYYQAFTEKFPDVLLIGKYLEEGCGLAGIFDGYEGQLFVENEIADIRKFAIEEFRYEYSDD